MRRVHFNALLAEFAKGHPRCTHVAIDVEVPWAADSPLWEPDGLHFSKEGYAELARKLARKLLDGSGILVEWPEDADDCDVWQRPAAAAHAAATRALARGAEANDTP